MPDLDQYIHYQVLLSQWGNHMQATKVIGRDNDANINAILQYGTNPILNTRVYDVMLFDVLIRQYSYNFIAENILN